MTYASGGLIQAADFNNIVGGSAGTQGGGTQLNPIWATGQGSYGYGQTAIGNVAVSGSVAASNWATLVNRLNSSRIHQSGSGSGISAPTAGTTISFLSTLTSAVSTAATNRLAAATFGTTTTSTKTTTLNAAAGVAATGTITFTITFGSGVDATRYFFNSRGSITVAYASFTNTGGTSRGTSIQTLAQTNFSNKTLQATNYTTRAGTGGTGVSDSIIGGYYTGLTTTPTQKFRVDSTSYYTGDFFAVNYSTNGTTGSYGANGNTITITVTAFSATTGSTQPADSINVTLGMTCTVQYPETTNLTNTWGTATIS
jgi:hypothetical protein